MRFLPYLIVVAAVVAVLVWSMQRVRGSAAAGPKQAALGARAADGELLGAAALAYGPERGPGRLRLTTTQLVFTADTGRVLVIERLELNGATLTHDLPDRSTASQLLAVATDDGTVRIWRTQP